MCTDYRVVQEPQQLYHLFVHGWNLAIDQSSKYSIAVIKAKV